MLFGRHLVGIERLRWLIGEVFVVIVGVLVALAIDQAWSDRLDRKLELEYLKGMRSAVQGDIEFNAGLRGPSIDRKLAAIEAVGPVVRGFEPIPDDIESFLRNIGMAASGGIAPSLTVSRGAFEELLSTGKFRLITNAQIRTALVQYYITQRAENQRLTARLTGYPEFVLGIYPGELRDELDRQAMTSFNIDRALDAIMSDEFETLFNREHNLAIFMKSRQAYIVETAESLLEELDAQIEELER